MKDAYLTEVCISNQSPTTIAGIAFMLDDETREMFSLAPGERKTFRFDGTGHRRMAIVPAGSGRLCDGFRAL